MARVTIHSRTNGVSGGMSRAEAEAIFATDAEIDQKVTDALAADSTVTDAAAAAVDTYVGTLDVLEAQDILEDDPVFAVVDADGRRTWLEAGTDGGLTDHALTKIGEHIVGATDMADSGANGLVFAVVDENDARTWLEADLDGKPTSRALTLIGDGLGAISATTQAAFPADDWAHWGDSLTAVGSSGDWVTKLATLTGRSHYNGGRGGESTLTIAGRQGGVPPRLTLSGNAIPATTTAVAVTDVTYSPLSNGDSRSGSINDIDGTLAQDASGNLTFTRTTAGDAVAVTPGTYWIAADGETYRDRTVTIFVGRNDALYRPPQEVVTRVREMIDYLSPAVKRVMVLEVPPKNTETTGTADRLKVDALNEALEAAFSPHWLDIASWLRTSDAATAAGITFTAQDTTDIANGVTPTSFTTDGLHFSDAGGTAVAARVYEEAQTRGWL